MNSHINHGSSSVNSIKAPRLAVVIVNWNVCGLLRDCLRSLEEDDIADFGRRVRNR